jgi:phage tail sheath protein FI
MPEYLAPGVYVEETSFRAKSIEGVGTSTTAFVGPTRRGPIVSTEVDAAGNPPAAPELLTSFLDFERMYGGIEDLTFGTAGVTNYLAQSVLQFFNEGGSRLYVARVANQATPAATADLGSGGGPVFIRSRFSGTGANGSITAAEISSPVPAAQTNSFPDGSLLRVSDPTAAPAVIKGGKLPADLIALAPLGTEKIVLNLKVNGQAQSLTFSATPATLLADDDLDDPVVIGPGDQEFRVRVNGALQVVTLPQLTAAADTKPADFLPMIQALLPAIKVTLNGNKLQFETLRRGKSASIEVLTEKLGFKAGPPASADPNTNNVADLSAVTLADVQAAVAALNAAAPAPVLEVVELSGGRFALQTLESSSAGGLEITGATGTDVSADGKLNLPSPGTPAATVTGTGSAPAFFERKTVNNQQDWFAPGTSTKMPAPAAGLRLEALSFSLVFDSVDNESTVFDDLAFGSDHPRFPATFLPEHPVARVDALFQPIYFQIGGGGDALKLHNALFPTGKTRIEDGRSVATHPLTGGSDGQHPMVGTPADDGSYAAAFELLRGVEDISIIAAPGSSDYPARQAIRNALIAHAERPRAYRIAVLDAPPRQMPGDVRDYRAGIDSNRAALYYPWVTVPNPLARPGRDDVDTEINLPPSGFICGIYARNDVEQSVSKAPGNEVVRGALRFESDINFAQQQLLNPLGINCLRFFPGRGYRVWGARTASSDPEFKYVNVRRFFLYLEASIDRGTQWVVFENNGPRLWANVRETVEAFLYNEWVSGNLLGATPKEAYFVRCDRSTMTQNDLDNGRLICLVGVAALKPAEFVIFRIGQKTADERS